MPFKKSSQRKTILRDTDRLKICATCLRLRQGPRRRKNWGLLVAGKVALLLVPSSVMLVVVIVSQAVAGPGLLACSSVKSEELVEGQETLTSFPARRTE